MEVPAMPPSGEQTQTAQPNLPQAPSANTYQAPPTAHPEMPTPVGAESTGPPLPPVTEEMKNPKRIEITEADLPPEQPQQPQEPEEQGPGQVFHPEHPSMPEVQETGTDPFEGNEGHSEATGIPMPGLELAPGDMGGVGEAIGAAASAEVTKVPVVDASEVQPGGSAIASGGSAEAADEVKISSNPEDEVAQRVEAGGTRYQNIIENLRKMGDRTPGTQQIIDRLDAKHNELLQKAREQYEKEQAELQAEQERLAAEKAEQESKRQEKLANLKEETLARVVGIATGEIRPMDDNLIDVLRFKVENGVIMEDHAPIFDDLDITDHEEYEKAHKEASTEVSEGEMEELINLVYLSLGADRPKDGVFKYRDNSYSGSGDKVIIHNGGCWTDVDGMPEIEIYESVERVKPEKELPEGYESEDVPVAERQIRINVRDLSKARS